MNATKAFTGGLAGGLVMTLALMGARKFGLTDLSLALLLGSMVTASGGIAVWWLGFFIHLMLSGIVGWLYGAAFEKITHRAGVRMGALLSIFHVTAAGILLGILPVMHPLLASPPQPISKDFLLAPGFFALNYGLTTAIVFFILHLVYGMIVGAVYKPAARHRWMYRRQPSVEHARKRKAA